MLTLNSGYTLIESLIPPDSVPIRRLTLLRGGINFQPLRGISLQPLLTLGGNTTKIHMAVDAFGLPIEFQLTGGEVHDAKAAPELIAKLPKADYTIADKGYDCEEIRLQIRNKSSIPIIPRKQNSKTGNADIDWGLYKYRHLVENVFAYVYPAISE